MISEIMKSKIYSRFDRKGYCDGITWKQINDYYKLESKDKIVCGYCGKELNENAHPPYRDAPSVDRIIPICDGGKNEFDNMEIVCTECNIIKGTMSLETFLEMKQCLEECGIKDKVFKEIFRGRKAAMLKRKVQLWELV